MSYKKPKRIPWKCPSVEDQERFVREYGMFESAAKQWRIHLCFMDPTHMVFNTYLTKSRQQRGRENTLKLESQTWRKRSNVLWLVNALNWENIHIINKEKCTQDEVITLLEKVRKHYSDGKWITIILDNARYHHAKNVKKRARRNKIILKYLPPYSPNLNLIERLWKMLKKKMSNIYLESFEIFVENIENVLQQMKWDLLWEVQNLINGKFEILKLPNPITL